MFCVKIKNAAGEIISLAIPSDLHGEAIFLLSDEIFAAMQTEQQEKDRYENESKRHLVNMEPETYDRLADPASLEDEVMNSLDLQRVFQIVNTCTATQRRRFILHYVYGYSVTELAAVENVNSRNIRLSLEQVMKKIQKNF